MILHRRPALLGFLRKPAALAVLLVLFLPISGCAPPDKWYDTGKIYSDVEKSSQTLPLEENLPPVAPQLLPLPEPVDGTISLSLEQAVLFSLQRNPELKIEQYKPFITETFEQIERGVYDPEFFAELQYNRETASEVSRSTRERFSVEAEDLTTNVGIRQQLPTGTEVEASVDYGRSTSNRTPEQQDVRLGLTVTQSLLRGFGPVINLVDIRLAELNSRISRYELRGFLETMVAEVETAYWQYVLARQGITIFEQSLTIARKQLEEVENRIEVGVIPRNSAAAARAEVARREQDLIEARSTQVERRLRLLRLLNVSDKRQFSYDLTPTSTPHTVAMPLAELGEHLELALQLRPDLNEAELRLKQRNLEVVRTRNGLLPRLDFFIDLGKTGYAESFNNSLTDLENENYDLLAGLRFSTRLGNRTVRAAHLAAQASRDQAQAAMENLKSLIHLDVLLAANEAKRTREQIEASKVTRQLQEQTLEAEQERFRVGDITSLLVAQAQRDLLVSRLAEIEAIVEYRIALVRFFLAEGSLLERRGIRLDYAKAQQSVLHNSRAFK